MVKLKNADEIEKNIHIDYNKLEFVGTRKDKITLVVLLLL